MRAYIDWSSPEQGPSRLNGWTGLDVDGGGGGGVATNTDATTEWVKKIVALGAGDKTTLLLAALRVAWAAAASPNDIVTVYRDKP